MMIFSDRFEVTTMMNDILKACVFIGSSLTVNNQDMGDINSLDAVISPTSDYSIEVNGGSVGKHQYLRSWSCGNNSDGPYVILETGPIVGPVKMILLSIGSE